MNNKPRKLAACDEIERVKFLRKATKDALNGSIALAIHNLGITETRNLLAKMRWQLKDFDPND